MRKNEKKVRDLASILSMSFRPVISMPRNHSNGIFDSFRPIYWDQTLYFTVKYNHQTMGRNTLPPKMSKIMFFQVFEWKISLFMEFKIQFRPMFKVSQNVSKHLPKCSYDQITSKSSQGQFCYKRSGGPKSSSECWGFQ